MRVMRFGRFVHQGITAESSVTARVKTSCGEVVIELDTNYPETVNSFVFLAKGRVLRRHGLPPHSGGVCCPRW